MLLRKPVGSTSPLTISTALLCFVKRFYAHISGHYIHVHHGEQFMYYSGFKAKCCWLCFKIKKQNKQIGHNLFFSTTCKSSTLNFDFEDY